MQSPPSLAPVPACLATQHPERTKNYPMVIYRAGALPRPPALRLHSLGALTYLRAHLPRPVLTPPHKKLSVPVPTPWQLKSGPGLDFLDRWRRCFRPHRLRRHHGQVCAPTGAGRRAAAQAGGILRLKSAWRLCLLWCLCRPVPCRAPAGWAPLAAKWSSGVGVRFPVAGRRRDHLSEGSRRREAPCSTWRPRRKVSCPRPARAPHRTPHLPAHTPRARSRAPCFHHFSPLTPLILAGDARSRRSILTRAKGAPEPLS